MHIQPIFAALRRNKAGAVLIGLQIALTLAIVCNALFIIQQRLGYLSRPSGLNEADLFVFDNDWVGAKDEQTPALAEADLATIRSTPGVVDAYRTNSYPLHGGGWSTGIALDAHHTGKSPAHSTIYFGDAHAIATLGLKLVAGRNFTAQDMRDFRRADNLAPPVAILTQSLADKLFPKGDALGKPIYVSENVPPSTVIGIVAELQTPWVGFSWADGFARDSTLVPERFVNPGSYFVVRTQPGRLQQTMQAVRDRLYAQNRMRVIDHLKTFADVRADAYRKDRAMAVLMAVVCAALLLVTAAGIVGLASFWVGQRQRQIGIRRALGATRLDILHYFQMENLLISGGGALLGIAAAIGLNLWLVTQYEMARLSVLFVALAAGIVLALGQLAVFQPALRASRVPPVVATRPV